MAARHLANRPIVAIWSSPLERALETASIVARRFALPVNVDGRLTEWKLNDRWAGVSWDELGDEFPGEVDAYLHDPLDLPFSPESLLGLAERIRSAIVDIARRYSEGDVVIVGHQDPVQAARLSLTGRSPAGQHIDKPGHASVITLDATAGWQERDHFTPDISLSLPRDKIVDETAVRVEGEVG